MAGMMALPTAYGRRHVDAERHMCVVFEMAVADAAQVRNLCVKDPATWDPNIVEAHVDQSIGIIRASWTGKGGWDTRDLRRMRDAFERSAARGKDGVGSLSPEPELLVCPPAITKCLPRLQSRSVETAKHSDKTLITARGDSLDSVKSQSLPAPPPEGGAADDASDVPPEEEAPSPPSSSDPLDAAADASLCVNQGSPATAIGDDVCNVATCTTCCSCACGGRLKDEVEAAVPVEGPVRGCDSKPCDYGALGTALGALCEVLELSAVAGAEAIPRRVVLRARRAGSGMLPPPLLSSGGGDAVVGTLRRSRSAQMGKRDGGTQEEGPRTPMPLPSLPLKTSASPVPPGTARCEMVLHLRRDAAPHLTAAALDRLQHAVNSERAAVCFHFSDAPGWLGGNVAAARRLPGLSPVAYADGVGSPLSSCGTSSLGSPAPTMLRPNPPQQRRGLERGDSRRRLGAGGEWVLASSSRASSAASASRRPRPAGVDPLLDADAHGEELAAHAVWIERPRASSSSSASSSALQAPTELAPVRPPSGRLPGQHPSHDARLSDVELARYLQEKYNELDIINRNFNVAKASVHCQQCNVAIPFDGTIDAVPCCDGCGQYTCVQCFAPYIAEKAAEEGATTTSTLCMHNGCNEPVPQADLRRYLPDAVLETLRMNEVKRLMETSKTTASGTLTPGQRRRKRKKFPCPDCEVLIEIDDSNLHRDLANLGEKVLTSETGTVEIEGFDLDYEAAAHYTEFRMRCGVCNTVFCADCMKAPYHIGKTCQWAANPDHCRFCAEKLTDDTRLQRMQLARAMGVVKDQAPQAGPPPLPLSWWRRALQRIKPGQDSVKGAGKAAARPLKPLQENVPRQDVGAQLKRKTSEEPDLIPHVSDAFLGAICCAEDCAQRAAVSSKKTLPCGHWSCGVAGEQTCLPCLNPTCADHPENLPSGDEYCSICWTETLESAPCLKLGCGHVVHRHCVIEKLKAKWPTAAISFQFMNCPLCNVPISHDDPEIVRLLEPVLKLKRDLAKRLIDRMKMEDLRQQAPDFMKNGIDEAKVFEWAQSRMNYYQCYQCEKPYFGGMRRCDANQDDGEVVKREQLLCGSCVDNTSCSIHGSDYIQFKCKYCCDVAVWFCWGTTHFCNRCHTTRENPPPRCKGPGICPLGGNHPPNGQEHAIGCVACLQECGNGRKHLKFADKRRL